VKTVKQTMVVRQSYNYPENAVDSEDKFFLAVNEALSTLDNAEVQFHFNPDMGNRAVIVFDMSYDETQGKGCLKDLPVGTQVVSHVSRFGITAGDVGTILGYDHCPIGALALVMFITPSSTGFSPANFRYLALQLGEYDVTGDTQKQNEPEEFLPYPPF